MCFKEILSIVPSSESQRRSEGVNNIPNHILAMFKKVTTFWHVLSFQSLLLPLENYDKWNSKIRSYFGRIDLEHQKVHLLPFKIIVPITWL